MCSLLGTSGRRRNKNENHGRKILGVLQGQGGVRSLRDKMFLSAHIMLSTICDN